jgi:DNA-binding HxlR family transcriptional regulator
VARALDTVGERWALMVVRELLLGPKRFTDLREGLPHVSPDVLAQRLRELEAAGVVRKRALPPPAASQVYELTSSGHALEPVLIELGRWGGANAAPPEEGMGMSLDSHVVSLRTLFVPRLAGDLDARVELRLGDQVFHAEVGDGDFHIDRGESDSPDATISTDPTTLIMVAHGHRSFADAVESGDLGVDGDEAVAERFMGLFPLPEPAI